MPGDPFIGGLWPAIWILGNLGRSTYEVSTNNIWPWSYNKCDRKKQHAQVLSACNRQNHYGMHPFQGRGATEIDIIEGMMGDSNGPLPDTKPNISLPYVDMTLQVSRTLSFICQCHQYKYLPMLTTISSMRLHMFSPKFRLLLEFLSTGLRQAMLR